MDEKESLAIAHRVQQRLQRQLPEFRFIAKRDEIEKQFKESEKMNIKINRKV